MKVKFKPYAKLAKLKDLKDSKHQRNKHPKDQIKLLAKMMKFDGVRHPINMSTLSGNIAFGHGRKAAALLNGWSEYPIVYQDFDSDEQEYVCVQSDNAIALWAELDLSSINSDIGDLGPDFDIELLGIKNFSLDPDFTPSDLDDQGKLDETKVVIMECPHCERSFEKSQAKVIG